MVLKASTMTANEKPLDNRAESSRIPLYPSRLLMMGLTAQA